MATYLTRTSILAAKDLKRKEIEVPEWDGTLIIREMTAFEREVFEKRMMEAGVDRASNISRSLGNLRASVVVMCAITEDGSPMFSDGDVKALNEKSGAVISRVFQECAVLSGISQEVVDATVGESEVTLDGGSS